jgi:MarR family transcriptional regulator, organic hydroperoxide resistance regulator
LRGGHERRCFRGNVCREGSGELCLVQAEETASIVIQRVYMPMLDALGVTYTQYLVLSTLWENDGLTISAIGERLPLERSPITPAVKRLEASGFVVRQCSVTDERLVEVHLTREGANLHPKTTCLTHALLRHSSFDMSQMIELNKRVQKLRQDMREATSEHAEAMERESP